jgi:uncharacterized membrane protein
VNRREQEAELARKVMDRAVRRLDILEYLILLLALILALVGGALVAWILGTTFGTPFRLSWAVASLLLFVVPGGAVYLRERAHRRPISRNTESSQTKEPNG